ncbi:MAG: AbrB/MazE/SpoVT family DNA-binding domain-containing protein, partial [Geobacter sp.]|nr:AbrB/MazE/SpoVT family DNA-binding domain-containing protein [Geobacter sp.]
MPIITLTDNNILTIPGELVQQLGLKPGDRLSVEIDGEGRLVLSPVRRAPPPPQPTLQQSINRKNLETSIQFIKGVGPKLAETLKKTGITTVEEALYLLPHRYEDRRTLI